MAEETGVTAYKSLGSDINKRPGEITDETKEGVVSEKLPELTLDLSDDEIIKLTEKWEKSWNDSDAKQSWIKQIEENEKYWLGKQFDLPAADKTRPNVDNIIFEGVETYLPMATRRNPEPLVSIDKSELDAQGNETPVQTAYVAKVKGRLIDLADENTIRLKLQKAGRHWIIYQLGVAKFGYDLDRQIPIVRIIRPQKVILDPEATVDEDGYNGNRVGEYRKMEAAKVIKIIGDTPENVKAIEAINAKVKNDLGTEMQFIEWWTPEYMCWKLGKTILLKKKNPHWNYDQESEPTTSVDDYGNESPSQAEPVKGINHFTTPRMPFEFMSIFNLGQQPMDKTSLINQNLSNQDRINKRNKQIDKNADRMNGGLVVSLERSGLTQGQAKGVSEALRKGGVVAIPSGSPREAIDQYSPTGLPSDVYNDRNDTRERIRDIFGIKGRSQAGLATEDTVRGKILSTGLDADRNGGVSEYLEQFADRIYNQLVQLLYVYDTGFQFVAGAVPPKIKISVKEGSLLPKDNLTIRNEALELAKLNRIATKDLLKIFEFPNYEEMAANVWLEANVPELMYPNNPQVQQAMQMKSAAAAAELAVNEHKSTQSHSQTMEREGMKMEMRGGSKKKGGSILSQVPTANADTGP